MKRSNECGCMGCDAEDKGREVCDCGEPICSECMLCPEHHVDHEELARYYPSSARPLAVVSDFLEDST